MRGIFTRDERAVVLFLAASLAIGSAVLIARRVEPGFVAPAEAETSRETARPKEPVWPIDLNAAGAEELLRLPGIGPVRAAAVVKLRNERGGFRSVDELLDVKGIGERTLERVRPLAVVGDSVRPAGLPTEADSGERDTR